MADDYLSLVRKKLKDEGRSKPEATDHLEVIQDIRREMNAAKMEAIRKAEEPFLARIKEAEEEYAIFLQLAS